MPTVLHYRRASHPPTSITSFRVPSFHTSFSLEPEPEPEPEPVKEGREMTSVDYNGRCLLRSGLIRNVRRRGWVWGWNSAGTLSSLRQGGTGISGKGFEAMRYD